MLNPLTSSLSPSAKSKGDRFASASTDTENNKNIIANHLPTLSCFFCDTSYIINIIDDSKIIVINQDRSFYDPSLSPTLFTNFQFRIEIFFDMMELVNLNAETVSVPKLNDNVVQIKVEQGAKEVLVQFLK